jgi:iron complex transport system ATP-binding protein
MLTVRDLSVEIAGTKILDRISFEAPPGEVIGLLGPNGSGKSTLIRTILGFVRKKTGWALYGGCDLANMKPKERARLFAYVPQNTALDSLYTVLECVLMGRYPYLKRFGRYGEKDFEKAISSLSRVGLDGFENRIVSTLSGGEAARVSCARALSQDAPVIMLDEPTSALDPKHSILITSIMSELAQEGKIVLVSMHDINLALNHTDKVIMFKEGRVFGEARSLNVSEKILGDLYDIPWEIWSIGNGKKLAAIPLDHSPSNTIPFIS